MLGIPVIYVDDTIRAFLMRDGTLNKRRENGKRYQIGGMNK